MMGLQINKDPKMSFKRVSFAVDTSKQCETSHHQNRAGCTTFQCTCGKRVCSQCRKWHVRNAKVHRCKVKGHVDNEKPVSTCCCGVRVCAGCENEHLLLCAARQCESPYHNKLNRSLCSTCTCGRRICDTCMPLHYV